MTARFRQSRRWLWRAIGAALLASLIPGFAISAAQRDETAGRPFPARELGVSRSFPSVATWPADLVAPSQGEMAREFGATWAHRGQREGVAFLLYRCPSDGRAAGLARLIGGEALGDTVIVVAAGAAEDKRLSVAAFLRAKLEAWRATLPPTEASQPVILRKLPAQGRQPDTERYAVGPLGLARADWLRPHHLPTPPGSAFAWAAYADKAPFERFLVAEYPTPQDATAALEAAQALASAQLLVARRGNFIVIADGVRDVRRAQAAIERVEYDYVVRWLGHPPPRASAPARTAQQDIRNIGQLLVSIASFVVLAGASMAFLGAVAGGAFFYWRRHQAGDGFIAADAMLRLDLSDDRALPDARGSSFKRLTD
ncbi:MAG: hypothetical protein CFK52_10830 [Chloracidobacterium sp. CP2_5A]|nr:MAG: hypothetical protein CFK52_10830 [Chloracidobacterium sp. CP2_5A]